MSGVNRAFIIGNCGQDPETRYMPSGGAVTNVSIATSEKWKDKQTGESKEKTEWHRVVFFNKLAEIAAEYIRKGTQIYVEGQLQTRKWQDKQGTDHYSTEIIGRSMQLLGGRPDGGSSTARPQSQSQSQGYQAPPIDDFEDDIPF